MEIIESKSVKIDRPQITLDDAIRLSEIKWKALLKCKYINKEKHPEIADLKYNCGFCERHTSYFQRIDNDNDIRYSIDCKSCEIRPYIGKCSNNGSLFDDYFTFNAQENIEKKNQLVKLMLLALQFMKNENREKVIDGILKDFKSIKKSTTIKSYYEKLQPGFLHYCSQIEEAYQARLREILKSEHEANKIKEI